MKIFIDRDKQPPFPKLMPCQFRGKNDFCAINGCYVLRRIEQIKKDYSDSPQRSEAIRNLIARARIAGCRGL